MDPETNKQTLEAAAWGDPDGLGILGRSDELDAVFESGERPSAKAPEKKEEIQPEVKKVETPAEKKEEVQAKADDQQQEKKEEKKEEKTDDRLEAIKKSGSDFFNEEEEKQGFDPEAFDKQTEAIVKKMQEAGHPGEAYREARAKVKELEERLSKGIIPEAVQQELDTLKTKAMELEGLRERFAEVTAKDAKLQVESSEEYEKEILLPVRSIMDKADQIASLYGVDSDIIKQIIRTQDPVAREALLKEHKGDGNRTGLGVVGSSDVAHLALQFQEKVAKRDEMLEQAEARIDEMRKNEAETAKLQLAQHRKAVQGHQEDYWDEHKELIPGFIGEDGKPTEDMTRLMNRAMSLDFSKARAKEQAFALFTGVAFPYVLEKLHEAQKELAKYQQGDHKDAQRSTSAGASIGSKNVEPPANKDGKRRTLLDDMNETEFAR